MTNLAAPHIVVPGAAFRNKVRLALMLWAKTWPHEVAQYKRDMRVLRERQMDAAGHWKDDHDMVSCYREPPRVPQLLGMSEWATKFRFGVPCGTGDNRWSFHPELYAIFQDEIREGFTSTFRGGTAEDKKRSL